MDSNPASESHALVSSERHSRDLLDIRPEDLTSVTLTAKRNRGGAEARQTVYYLHLHVVPRYVDKTKDRLGLPWRPVTAGEPGLVGDLGRRVAAHL